MQTKGIRLDFNDGVLRGKPGATCVMVWCLASLVSAVFTVNGVGQGMAVGSFQQSYRIFYSTADGLPDSNAYTVAIAPDSGIVYAGTANGAAKLMGQQWQLLPGIEGAPVRTLAVSPAGKVYLIFQGYLYEASERRVAPLPAGVDETSCCLALSEAGVFLGTDRGLYQLKVGEFEALIGLNTMLSQGAEIRQVAIGDQGDIAVAARAGLFYRGESQQTWTELRPADESRAWWPRDSRAVGIDSQDRLWFACAQGMGYREDTWRLFEGKDGLPYDDFTALAAGHQGQVWLGTRLGAIHFDGNHWAYRQGLRWLPGDHVRDVAVARDGSAWFASPAGIGVIRHKSLTFAEKARYYEAEIDRRHRRTRHGFILQVYTDQPGDATSLHQTDSDNDGLWTSMYGAG